MIEGDSYLLIVLVWVEESCDKKMMWDTYFDDDCDSENDYGKVESEGLLTWNL